MVILAGCINGATSRTCTAPMDRVRAVLATGVYSDTRTVRSRSPPSLLPAPPTDKSHTRLLVFHPRLAAPWHGTCLLLRCVRVAGV